MTRNKGERISARVSMGTVKDLDTLAIVLGTTRTGAIEKAAYALRLLLCGREPVVLSDAEASRGWQLTSKAVGK